jgi:tetratricopeptide (TPR) repeat protein
LDRKETEFRAEVAAELPAEAPPEDAVSPGETAPRTDELFRQGEDHFAAGRFHQAIHVWTRILFVDRGSAVVREAIERAKQVIAERQRRLDLECAEAVRLLESGDVEQARVLARAVLAADPSHVEASHLEEKVVALERRHEPAREPNRGALESAPSKGIVLRVPRGERARPGLAPPTHSRVKMIAFIAAALLVFAVCGLYLYENWEGIVSDGAFRHPVTSASSPGSAPAPPVPGLAELRYYNGARLFNQGRYREALAELSRIDRGSKVTAEARSLILRVEERLLRSAPEENGSQAPGLSSPAEPIPGSSSPASTGATVPHGGEVPK